MLVLVNWSKLHEVVFTNHDKGAGESSANKKSTGYCEMMVSSLGAAREQIEVTKRGRFYLGLKSL